MVLNAYIIHIGQVVGYCGQSFLENEEAAFLILYFAVVHSG